MFSLADVYCRTYVGSILQFQVPNLDAIVGSVSGGGFVAGMCVASKVRFVLLKAVVLSLFIFPIYVQNINPKIKIVAAEPRNADDCARSFAAGKRLANETPPNTICDALK